MTTQTPYEPPPHGSYPTSPPWATPPSTPPPPGPEQQHLPDPPWGSMQYTQQHGQLLVPYPEEMFNAARPRPPSWFPVVLFTFFFGPLGAISAARRASRAKKGHNDRHPYWIAFGVTWVAGVVLSAILLVSVGIPAYLNVLHQAQAKAAQEHTTK